MFWPCSGNGGACVRRNLAEGAIKGDSAHKFREFLDNKNAHEYVLPPEAVAGFGVRV